LREIISFGIEVNNRSVKLLLEGGYCIVKIQMKRNKRGLIDLFEDREGGVKKKKTKINF